jgi:putative PIN family toxin of toxin-antitoxin system
MRVVFDTNVFISGLIFGGKPQVAMEFVLSDGCTLIVSEPILEELGRKLLTKFGWLNPAVDSAVKTIRDSATAVAPDLVLTDCVDPDDNMFLEAAVEGRADCVVSGDQHLLRMKRFRGIEILTVSDFLLRIGS